jgi:hypothetical protein
VRALSTVGDESPDWAGINKVVVIKDEDEIVVDGGDFIE